MHQETINTGQYASVIIAGAGPTGLALGNLLGMAGIDTLILERNAGLSDFPKAIALDDEGLRVCQAMGLLEPMLQHVLLNVSAHYVSGKRLLASVAPTGNKNGFPLISTFQQPQFEAILLGGLKRFKCVIIAFQHTVEACEQNEQGVIVTVRIPDGSLKTINCAYLLACDGGKSTIRRALGIPMQGSTYAQKWLVIDSIQDEHSSKTITFFCNPQRPAVTVPSPQQGRRWEFMLLPGEQEAELLKPETIHQLIQQVSGAYDPHIIRQAIYTFHAVLASSFSKGRVFLLGDAAHQMPPFGGQGMNSGLRDAHNLSWKLSLVLQGLASPSLLDTYNVERRAHSAQMINLSKFAGNVVMPTARSVALFRDTLFLALNAIPAARKYIIEMRIKPQPRYKKGFMLAGADESAMGAINRPRRGSGTADGSTMGGTPIGADLSRPSPIHRPMVGMMLPQPQVTTLQGDKVLLDEILGTGFALLRYLDTSQGLHPRAGASPTPTIPEGDGPHRHMVGAGLAPALDAVPEQSIWTTLHVRHIWVLPGISPPVGTAPCACPGSTQLTIIRSDQLSAFLKHDPDLFVLVRPDRYIFGAFRQKQAAAFAAAFQKLLQL